MKIIYIGNRYFSSGDPGSGSSNNYHNYYDGLVRMNSGENQAIFFPMDLTRKRVGVEGANKELLELALKEKPDLLFAHAMDSTQQEVMKKIRESGITTFIWFFDDHWDFYKGSKYWAPYFNWVFTTDPLAVEKYHKIGCKNAFFMPQGYNHFIYKPLDLPKIYDVTFVGNPHGSRRKIIKKLQAEGIKVTCFGKGWPKGPISTEDKIKMISQSKINLNLAESSGTFLKQLALIFVHRNFDRSISINSPSRWHDNFLTLLAQKRKQIKGRIFKIAGCGGFLLTGYAEGMENLYEPDKEAVYFHNIGELVEKIKYYLSHDKEREDIAKAGRERSIRDHTLEKKYNDMFKIMGFNKK